jgi:hypothetical protein
MKTKIFYFTTLIVALNSCVTQSEFYQVYKISPVSTIQSFDDNICYEDSNCIIIYDFWAKGGNAGFQFYNKSKKVIEIQKDKCFYILNNISYDYYQNRIYSSSSTKGVGQNNSSSSNYGTSSGVNITGYNYLNLIQSNSVTNQMLLAKSNSTSIINYSENGLSREEEKVIKIPPKTSKFIKEYEISETIFEDCNLIKFPKDINSVTSLDFSKENSPVVFSNIISYLISGEKEIKAIETKFYVSELKNLPKDIILKELKPLYCDVQGETSYNVLLNLGPLYFYNKYFKIEDKKYISNKLTKPSGYVNYNENLNKILNLFDQQSAAENVDNGKQENINSDITHFKSISDVELYLSKKVFINEKKIAIKFDINGNKVLVDNKLEYSNPKIELIDDTKAKISFKTAKDFMENTFNVDFQFNIDLNNASLTDLSGKVFIQKNKNKCCKIGK